MQHNPLTQPISQILEQAESKMSEYELLKALELNDDDFGEDAPAGSDLALFRQHFLIMNALYSLQPKFLEKGFKLYISALDIYLMPLGMNTSYALSTDSDQAIRAYYLDWNEFTASNQESVNKLLDSFWERYLNHDQYSAALQTLGLEPDASYDNVKARYRKLASEHHPDKGGCKAKFNEIREAYEIIISITKKT